MAPNSLLDPCFHGQQVTNCQKLSRVQHRVEVFSVQFHPNQTGSWQKVMIQFEVVAEPGWLSVISFTVASHWIVRSIAAIYLSEIYKCYECRLPTPQTFRGWIREWDGTWWHLIACLVLAFMANRSQTARNCPGSSIEWKSFLYSFTQTKLGLDRKLWFSLKW